MTGRSHRAPRGAVLAVLLGLGALCGCSPFRLLEYAAAPDAPRFRGGEQVPLPGLGAPVEVAQRVDGMFRIRAASESDAALVEGYLMARDRMAQLDLFRHMANGELAEFLGDRPFGERTTLELDVLNRFLGFRGTARDLLAATPDTERAVLEAFVAGINRWIDERHLPLEHRLLGVASIQAWHPEDSLAIYAMLMHGMSGNADREVRRLVVACRAGLDGMERVWPTDIEFDTVVLPESDLRTGLRAAVPSVVPEMREALAGLCPPAPSGRVQQARAERGLGDVLHDGWSASNNWVVSGALSESGKPLLSSDPHLPHMNPPIVWGVEIETPDNHVAGFVVAGLHRVVFGHNGRVAFGATTNHVDRQDLVVYRPRTGESDGRQVEGYERDGRFYPFGRRTETFRVKGGAVVQASARTTPDGVLLNDIDPLARDGLPLVALRLAPTLGAGDLDGARRMNRAHDVDELVSGVDGLDLGCSNWVLADDAGSIAYRSPCVVPVREGYSGAFPVPGWTSRYAWRGFYDKQELPTSRNPARGWLATANNQVVPSARFPSTYNADAAGPNRYGRIAGRLAEGSSQRRLSPGDFTRLQVDLGYDPWTRLRAAVQSTLCAGQGSSYEAERELLCRWDGDYAPESAGATLFVLFTHAVLDRALADEFPAGSEDAAWRFVQSLPQFETRVDWLWQQPADAQVWDDVRTPSREGRSAILEAALGEAASSARARYGGDPAGWRWGSVRPFVLRHPFAPRDGVLGWFLNQPPLAVGGAPETVFKNQFPRSDRERMNPLIGPVVRLTVDLADPWRSGYALAGGQSGWPLSEHYGDLLVDWSKGRYRPLTPPPVESDIAVRFIPAG